MTGLNLIFPFFCGERESFPFFYSFSVVATRGSQRCSSRGISLRKILFVCIGARIKREELVRVWIEKKMLITIVLEFFVYKILNTRYYNTGVVNCLFPSHIYTRYSRYIKKCPETTITKENLHFLYFIFNQYCHILI